MYLLTVLIKFSRLSHSLFVGKHTVSLFLFRNRLLLQLQLLVIDLTPINYRGSEFKWTSLSNYVLSITLWKWKLLGNKWWRLNKKCSSVWPLECKYLTFIAFEINFTYKTLVCSEKCFQQPYVSNQLFFRYKHYFYSRYKLDLNWYWILTLLVQWQSWKCSNS